MGLKLRVAVRFRSSTAETAIGTAENITPRRHKMELKLRVVDNALDFHALHAHI
jgi:hypothetical protein